MRRLLRAHSYQCPDCLTMLEQLFDAASGTIVVTHPSPSDFGFIDPKDCPSIGAKVRIVPEYVAVKPNGKTEYVEV